MGDLSWFPCEPTPLLAALAGMKAPKKLVYLMTILRIYECGGGCPDTVDAIAMRVGLNRRIVSDALDELFREGRLVRGEGGIHNPKADVVIAESMVRLKRRKAASAGAANSRWQKAKENQQNHDANRNANAMQIDAQRQIQEQDSLFSNENRVLPKATKPKVPRPKPEPVDDGWPVDCVDQFWSAFPPYRRTNKKAVGEKLARIRAAGQVTWSALMAGLTRYAMSDPGEFAKAPVAWLNAAGWEGVYKIQNGGNHAANRPSNSRDGYAVITARLRQSISERDAGLPPGHSSAAGGESDHGYRDAAVVGGLAGGRQAAPDSAPPHRSRV